MRGSLAAALALTLSASFAHAQSDEPTPPGGGPMKIDMNAREEEPPPPPTHTASTYGSDGGEIGKYQLGARARGIFVTKTMLSPYFAAGTGTELTSYSVGIELTYRRKSYDVVTSLDFSWLPLTSGNLLGAGHHPDVDTHYVEFHNLSFLSADVSIIGHHKFLPWLELRYGGGLGLGWVPGDVYLVNNGPQCTSANAKDTSQCYPVSNNQPIKPSDPMFHQKLDATNNGQTDTAADPHWHASGDKPPVMAVVNLLVGLRFYPVPRMGITVEVGFRDAIFTGLGLTYLF